MKAFPCKAYVQDKTGVVGISEYSGMDLRDYFAAKAMQSLANAWAINKSYPSQDTELAECSYQVADAMMEARKK